PRCFSRLMPSVLVLLLALPLFGHAQDAALLEKAISNCYAISSVAVRIDCYDALARSRQVDAESSLAAPAPTNPTASPAAPAADLRTAATASAEIDSMTVPESGQHTM